MNRPHALSRASYRAIVWWCADECRRQGSGEMSVARMFRGWDYAFKHSAKTPLARDVLALGRLVDPEKNSLGYRQRAVGIQHNDVYGSWVSWIETKPEQVPRQIETLLGSVEAVPCPEYAEEFFMHFETVHPFRDGNGRVGAILYNWLRGTLDAPETAPEYRKPKSELLEA